MTAKRIILIALAFIAVIINADGKRIKRGVGENAFSLQEEFDVLYPGVGWFYSWGNVPNNNIINIPDENMVFIPMCWNANYNADNIRNYCKQHPETKYLLGFNEPNFVNQANMSPEVAAEKWPAVKALAQELGLKLVGPAVNYSPDGPENDPYTWYANFVKLVGNDAFDYIAIHNYSGGSAGMKNMIDKFYSLYGKQIWVTEFCNWAGTVTPESQISSMIQQLEYLEKSDKVFKYAWFKAKGSTTTSPCYGLIVPKNGYGERELSEQGKVYVYMTDFDDSIYHSTTEVVAASEYIASNGLMLGSTNDNACQRPIEITKFNAGAYADYQFDIPTDGSYTLKMRCGGMGEPTRFDPYIGIYSVDNDGNVLSTLCAPRLFSLTNDENKYAEVEFPMTLKAGKQRIRLRDDGPYSPSGIRISNLSFSDNGSVANLAVDDVKAYYSNGTIRVTNLSDCAIKVCDLNGRIVASGIAPNGNLNVGNLTRGLYIASISSDNGKLLNIKISVK